MAEVMPAEAAPVMMSMQQKLQQVAEAKAEDPAAASKEGPRAVTVRTPQIHWHGKSPVFAVDFHPHFGRLCATGGLEPDGTGGVHLWIVNDSTGESADKAPVSFVQDLQGHEKSVNCVRFCPKGDLLASAGVEGSVVIWRRTSVAPSAAAAIAGHEKWEYMTMLRAQTLDVVDLSWSPSCTQLATASVDNTAAVLNIAPNKEKVAANIRGHDHFALGVAWDPKEEFILTVSSDGSSRFHTSKSRKWKADARTAHITCKMEFPNKKNSKPAGFADGEKPVSKEFKMFLDDSMAAHRRRAAWSPDGLFAVVPAGLYQQSASSAPFYVSHVLARRNPTKSFALLPSGRKPSVAVRFCPTIFKLSRHAAKDSVAEGVPTPEKLFTTPLKAGQEQATNTGFNLPYKMVFAVATSNSILIYDTEQIKTPFLYVTGIHFDSLTDLAWSKDGQHLIATSKDGYCSIIEFASGELGEPLDHEFLPPVVAKNSMPGKSIDLTIKDPDDVVATATSEETNAQKLAEMVAAPAPLPEPVIEYKEGDKVQARWNGGAWFVGTIMTVNDPDGEEPEADKEGEGTDANAMECEAKEGETKEGERKEGESKEGETKEGEDGASLETEVEPVAPAVKQKTYSVKFDDGDFDPAVPADHIKHWEDKRARKRRIVPQVVKNVEDLTKAPNAAPSAANDTTASAGSSAKEAIQLDSDSAAESQTPEKDQMSTAGAATAGGEVPPAMAAMAVDDTGAPAAAEGKEAHASSSSSATQPPQEAAPKKRRIIPTTIVAAP